MWTGADTCIDLRSAWNTTVIPISLHRIHSNDQLVGRVPRNILRGASRLGNQLFTSVVRHSAGSRSRGVIPGIIYSCGRNGIDPPLPAPISLRAQLNRVLIP
jgi:hypothetical protein